MRLIDGDALIESIRELLLEPDSAQYIWSSDVLVKVRDAPTVGGRLVYCAECVHHHHDSTGIPYCDRFDYGYGWEDDNFCSMGVKRDAD